MGLAVMAALFSGSWLAGLYSARMAGGSPGRLGDDRPRRTPPPARAGQKRRWWLPATPNRPRLECTALMSTFNKIAVPANSRGGDESDVVMRRNRLPDMVPMADRAHPPDARHIAPTTCWRSPSLYAWKARRRIRQHRRQPVRPPRPAIPGLLALCKAARPRAGHLRPDGDGHLPGPRVRFRAMPTGLRPLVATYQRSARGSACSDVGVILPRRAADCGAPTGIELTPAPCRGLRRRDAWVSIGAAAGTARAGASRRAWR